MKIFKPFRNNVLVEKLEIKVSVILPGDHAGKWIRLKVLAVGPEVKEDIKPGMVVLAENMFEKVDLLTTNIGLIVSQYIHVEEAEDGKFES